MELVDDLDSWILTQRFKTGDQLSLLLPLSTNISIFNFCQGQKFDKYKESNNIISML
jgi:hypothetical protein